MTAEINTPESFELKRIDHEGLAARGVHASLYIKDGEGNYFYTFMTKPQLQQLQRELDKLERHDGRPAQIV
jgi:hypothetical protein